MPYSLREINQQIRTDPQGFARRSDDAYTEKVKRAAHKIAAGRNPTSCCSPVPPAPARPPPP